MSDTLFNRLALLLVPAACVIVNLYYTKFDHRSAPDAKH